MLGILLKIVKPSCLVSLQAMSLKILTVCCQLDLQIYVSALCYVAGHEKVYLDNLLCYISLKLCIGTALIFYNKAYTIIFQILSVIK